MTAEESSPGRLWTIARHAVENGHKVAVYRPSGLTPRITLKIETKDLWTLHLAWVWLGGRPKCGWRVGDITALNPAGLVDRSQANRLDDVVQLLGGAR